MLQWFRRKLREPAEAPAEAAPTAQPEEEQGEAPAAERAADGETKPRRRRGTRGGRGRKKAGEGAAPAVAAPERGRQERRSEERPKPKRRRSSPRRAISSGSRSALAGVEKEILVSVEVGEQRVAVLEDGKPAEVYLERPGRRSIAGNVYKGVVDNVLPGMEASFVEIGLERNGFLYVDEIVVPELEGKRHGRRIQELIQRGQEVLVQAVKDPMGSKGARLTTEISLPGRFLVYTPFGEGVGISRRLPDAERERLKAISRELDLPEGGIIIRTAAEDASREELEGDLALLRKLWATIHGRAARAKAPTLVYQEAELPLRIVRDLFIRDFERVVVDHERTYRRLVAYLKRTSTDLAARVELYEGKEPLMQKSGVDAAVRSTLDRRVALPSGGSLVFDYAEAFTVVDVNTGRFVGGRGKASGARLEDTITKNNLEAVEEVVRQLRLRDVGGIIVIDFIDMANPKNRALVEDALRRELEKDRTKTFVVEISPLGLVEMTRQNVTEGPREILTVACPTCAGEGVVLSEETHAAEAERSLRRLVAESRHQAFRVELNSRVARILIGPGASRLVQLEEETGRRFFLEPRDDVPADRFHVLARGPVSRLGAKSLPVSAGDELDVRLEERPPEAGGDAIARLDGYTIAVAADRAKLGDTVRVRIQRATPTVAYAVPVDGAAPEPPVEAGIELERDAAGEPTEKPKRASRRGSRGGRGRKTTAETAADTQADDARAPVASAPAVETADAGSGAEPPAEPGPETPSEPGPAGEAPPKKRTRRGSRGGRGRKRKAETAAQPGPETPGAGGPADDGAPPRDETPAAPAETAATAEGDAAPETAEKPRKRTRRGTRGGRNRRRKRELAEAGDERSEEPVAAVAGGEEPGAAVAGGEEPG